MLPPSLDVALQVRDDAASLCHMDSSGRVVVRSKHHYIDYNLLYNVKCIPNTYILCASRPPSHTSIVSPIFALSFTNPTILDSVFFLRSHQLL